MLLIDQAHIAGARQAVHGHPVGAAQPAALARGFADPAGAMWADPLRYLEALAAIRRDRRVS